MDPMSLKITVRENAIQYLKIQYLYNFDTVSQLYFGESSTRSIPLFCAVRKWSSIGTGASMEWKFASVSNFLPVGLFT